MNDADPRADLSEIIDRAVELGPDALHHEVQRLGLRHPRLAEALAAALGNHHPSNNAAGQDDPEHDADDGDPIADIVGRAASIAADQSFDPPDLEPFGLTALSVIGEGGSAVVYRAEQRSPRRSVAVKVVPLRQSAPDGEFFEADVASRLTHPNIVTVLQSGTAETRSGDRVRFLAMELVDGVPLTDYAAREGLRWRQRARLLAQLAEVIKHAHERGVSHGDLKPANVLIDQAGHLRVLDFGVSSVAVHGMRRDGRSSDSRAITSRYTSPRRRNERSTPNELDDLYALGVLAIDLFAGPDTDPPSHAPPRSKAALVAIPETPALRRRALGHVICSALQINGPRSYASAQQMLDDLRSIVGVTVGGPASPGPRLRALLAAHRAMRFAPIAAACCLAALTAALAINAYAELRDARDAHLAQAAELRQELSSARADADTLGSLLRSDARRAGRTSDVLVEWARELARGDVGHATALAERVRRAPGGEQPDLWASATAARILIDSGSNLAALQMLEEVAAPSRAHPPREQRLLAELEAEAHLAAGAPSRAAESAQRMLELAQTAPNRDRTDAVVTAASLLARARAASGAPGEGMRALDEHVAPRAAALPPELSRKHLIAMASCLYAAGEMVDTADVLNRALTAQPPPDRRDLREELEILSMLASAQSELGQSRQSFGTLSHVESQFRNVLGPRHPRTIEATYQLARAELRVGAIASGIRRLEYCIDGLQLQEQLPVKAAVLDALADAYESAGERAQAAHVLEQLVQARRELAGPDENEWVIMAEFRLVRARIGEQTGNEAAAVALLHELRGLLSRAISAGGTSSPVARAIYSELHYNLSWLRARGADLGGLDRVISPR